MRARDREIANTPERDRRYETLLGCFKAARLLDPYSPTAPTLIARRFNEDRELPEERVTAMFEAVLSSPSVHWQASAGASAAQLSQGGTRCHAA